MAASWGGACASRVDTARCNGVNRGRSSVFDGVACNDLRLCLKYILALGYRWKHDDTQESGGGSVGQH